MCHRRHQGLVSEDLPVAPWIVAARESPGERGRAGVRFFSRIDQQTSGPNEAAKNATPFIFLLSQANRSHGFYFRLPGLSAAK
jgi:hypothetical protein